MKIDYSQIVDYSVGLPKDSNKDIKYILAGNGSIEVRDNEIATFSTSVKKIPGLDDIQEGIQLKLPKIPSEFLFQTISFFKDVNSIHKAEAIVQIYWNRESKSYFIHCPKQKISGASVDFDRDVKMEKKHLLVVDIHSHNTMDAFFSSTDNADEKEARLYGVIGKIEDAIPKILFRASTGNVVMDVAIDKIFSMSTPYPKTWMNQIKKKEELVTQKIDSLFGKEWDCKNGLWNSDGREPERWNGKEWTREVGGAYFKEDIKKEDDAIEEAYGGLDTVDIVELREQLIKRLSDTDKEFLATELYGSIQTDIGGIDNGGYKIGK